MHSQRSMREREINRAQPEETPAETPEEAPSEAPAEGCASKDADCECTAVYNFGDPEQIPERAVVYMESTLHGEQIRPHHFSKWAAASGRGKVSTMHLLRNSAPACTALLADLEDAEDDERTSLEIPKDPAVISHWPLEPLGLATTISGVSAKA